MPQTNLKKAQARARELGVTVMPSTRKHKKLDVYDSEGRKVASIGHLGYSDFLQHGDPERRRMYKKRHEKNRHKVGTPGFYADKILW